MVRATTNARVKVGWLIGNWVLTSGDMCRVPYMAVAVLPRLARMYKLQIIEVLGNGGLCLFVKGITINPILMRCFLNLMWT